MLVTTDNVMHYLSGLFTFPKRISTTFHVMRPFSGSLLVICRNVWNSITNWLFAKSIALMLIVHLIYFMVIWVFHIVIYYASIDFWRAPRAYSTVQLLAISPLWFLIYWQQYFFVTFHFPHIVHLDNFEALSVPWHMYA